jgi:hypothetical protein
VVALPDGWRVLAGDRVIDVDDAFAVRDVIALGPGVEGAHLLDHRYAIVKESKGGPVVTFDLEHPYTRSPRPVVGAQLFDVDRETRRVMYSDEHGVHFARYGAAGAISEDHVAVFEGVAIAGLLLDPYSSGGYEAMVVTEGAGRHSFLKVASLEPLRVDATAEPIISSTPDSRELLASHGGDDRRVSAESPHGFFAELSRDQLSLRTATGALVWTVVVPGATDLAWSATGDLVVAGGGLAHVGLLHGEVYGARCGWQFGLWLDDPHPAPDGALCGYSDGT